MPDQFPAIMFHPDGFVLDVLADQIPETFVGDPVRRPGFGGQKTTGDLVFALGAGFEALQAVVNAVFQSLVVTGFEVQAVKVGATAPVTAIQCFRSADVEGAGHVLSLMFCQHQHDIARQGPADLAKEAVGKGGVAVFAIESVGVETVPDVPLAIVDFIAVQDFEFDALVPHAAAFLFDLFAFAGGQSIEEVIEVCIALIGPVKLAAEA